MSEQANGGTAQEAGAGNQQGGQEPPVTQGNGPEGGQPGGEGAPSQEEMNAEKALETVTDPNVRSYLEKIISDGQKARNESANYRTKYQQEKEAADELRRQNETDAERQEREAQESQERTRKLEEENRSLKIDRALDKAVTDARAYNPATVAALLSAKVELDDDGQPSNLADLVKDLKRTDPYLFKRETNDAGDGNGQRQRTGSSVNDMIRGRA